jgi:hypothetical protein
MRIQFSGARGIPEETGELQLARVRLTGRWVALGAGGRVKVEDRCWTVLDGSVGVHSSSTLNAESVEGG